MRSNAAVLAVQAAEEGRLAPRIAPVKGWTSFSPLAKMDERFALTLDNFIPRETECELRGGQANHATGMTGEVKSLLLYTSPTIRKMFAAVGADIFDVSAAGAVGAAALSGLSGSEWEYVNFATTAPSYNLLMVNGLDDLRRFDGASWTIPVITGVGIAATSDFNNISMFKRRVWLVKKASLSPYYLPLDSIAGTATELVLGSLFKEGGSLLAIGNWTLDSGDGVDDLVAFITTEGEIAVFSGVNPASDFLLVGVFKVPKPIGKRCFIKFGSELLIITEEGVFPISKALGRSRIDPSVAVTYNIAPEFRVQARVNRSTFGWSGQLVTEQSLLVVNIPKANGNEAAQYVMNTLTRAWCRFLGFAAVSWAVFNNELYFGGTDKVVKTLTTTDDFGNNIEGKMLTAFSNLHYGGSKQLQLIRPNLTVNGNVTMAMDVLVDYNLEIDWQEANVDLNVAGSSLWDTALWDSGIWAYSDYVPKEWKTVGAFPGIMIAHALRVQTKVAVSLASFDNIYVPASNPL